MANENLSSSFFIVHDMFHFVLSVFHVSFGRIDSHSILYDCAGSLYSYQEKSQHYRYRKKSIGNIVISQFCLLATANTYNLIIICIANNDQSEK
jgi:hypothetical protein